MQGTFFASHLAWFVALFHVKDPDGGSSFSLDGAFHPTHFRRHNVSKGVSGQMLPVPHCGTGVICVGLRFAWKDRDLCLPIRLPSRRQGVQRYSEALRLLLRRQINHAGKNHTDTLSLCLRSHHTR